MMKARIYFKRIFFCLTLFFSLIGFALAASENVTISKAKVVAKTEGIEASISVVKGESFKSSAILRNVDDYVTYEIVLKNGDKEDYKIKDIIDDNKSPYVKTTYKSDEVLKASGEASIYMTVKLDKLVDDVNALNDEDYYELGKLNIMLSFEKSDGSEVSKTIVKTPDTGKNSTIYLILGSIIFSVGAFIIIFIKKGKTILQLIIFAALMLSATTILAEKNYDILLVNDSGIRVKVGTYTIVDGNKSIKNIHNKSITNINVPSEAGYEFLGFILDTTSMLPTYTDTNGNGKIAIDFAQIEDENVILYAVWSKKFDIENNAVKAYYSNIGTWKTSGLYDKLVSNLDNNFCKYIIDGNIVGGDIDCSQPGGYNTGLSDDIVVYDYNVRSGEISQGVADYIYVDTQDEKKVIYNMIPGHTYYFETVGEPAAFGFVKAEGTLRMLKGETINNLRDLGGMPATGGTIKYGRLFRGTQINFNPDNDPEKARISNFVKLGITSEFDLRTANEADNTYGNNYKLSDIGLKYQRMEGKQYGDAFKNEEYEAYFLSEVVYLMQEINSGKNVYFHCLYGADRTGTLAYVLEGILGVSLENRIRDYELTSFYLPTRNRDVSGFSTLLGYEPFASSEAITRWLYDGIKDNPDIEDPIKFINDFRTSMIAGSPTMLKASDFE